MKNPIHVAFVDDEHFLHKIIQFHFKKEITEGLIILHNFLDGEECLNHLQNKQKTEPLQHIFTDLIMPKVDGFTLVSLVGKSHPEIALYILSATEQDRYRDRLAEINLTGFFTKPINFSSLKKFIIKQEQPCL